ncbi:UDP-N-acetylglucosamine transporter [Trichinella spiralis]|uniref:UDP-N-acetylglucosamine transporter n=1 Tax=Trichinella spiralis TaxID=6334 RepID=A0ABR3KCA3_TRISP
MPCKFPANRNKEVLQSKKLQLYWLFTSVIECIAKYRLQIKRLARNKKILQMHSSKKQNSISWHSKCISLGVLVFTTSSVVLLLRYSRTMNVTDGRYLSSTAVALSEVLKVVISLVMIFHEAGYSVSEMQTQLRTEMIVKRYEILVQSGCSDVSNNLSK